MLFRKSKEQQSLINASRKSLAEAEEKIEKLSEELRIARHNNTVLLERNRKQAKVLKEYNEKTELIKRITDLLEINKYNNEKAILRTIKELISDFDSQN